MTWSKAENLKQFAQRIRDVPGLAETLVALMERGRLTPDDLVPKYDAHEHAVPELVDNDSARTVLCCLRELNLVDIRDDGFCLAPGARIALEHLLSNTLPTEPTQPADYEAVIVGLHNSGAFGANGIHSLRMEQRARLIEVAI